MTRVPTENRPNPSELDEMHCYRKFDINEQEGNDFTYNCHLEQM